MLSACKRSASACRTRRRSSGRLLGSGPKTSVFASNAAPAIDEALVGVAFRLLCDKPEDCVQSSPTNSAKRRTTLLVHRFRCHVSRSRVLGREELEPETVAGSLLSCGR